MQGFKDSTGRVWRIPRLTIGLVRDVEKETGINIYKAAEEGGQLIQVLLAPFTLCGILWALCEPQAKESNINEEDFAHLLTSDVIEKAGEELVEAVLDFFPKAKTAAVMKSRLRGQMEKIDALLIAQLNSSFGDSPASQA